MTMGDVKDTSEMKVAPIVLQPNNSEINAWITLNKSNYDVWPQMMEIHITGWEKILYICGKSKPPNEEDATHAKWYAKN